MFGPIEMETVKIDSLLGKQLPTIIPENSARYGRGIGNAGGPVRKTERRVSVRAFPTLGGVEIRGEFL